MTLRRTVPTLGWEAWALLALTRALGLPFLWQMWPDVQVRLLAEEGTGVPPGPRLDNLGTAICCSLTAVGTGVDLWGHPHITQQRIHSSPRHLQAHTCTHTHAYMQHPGTQTRPLTMVNTPPNPQPPSVGRILYPHLVWTTLFLGPPSPSLFLPPGPVPSTTASPSCRDLPSGSTQVGEGEEAAIAPFPPQLLPGVGAWSWVGGTPPAPIQDQGPPTRHTSTLPPDSPKAGVVWEEFRRRGRWGMGTEEKEKRR